MTNIWQLTNILFKNALDNIDVQLYSYVLTQSMWW